MDKNMRLKLIQRYVANWAIGPSTLRGQGTGVTGAAKRFLIKELDIKGIADKGISGYRKWLDDRTAEMKATFPHTSQENWGAARKAINLFMVGAYFNKILSQEHNLESFGDVLEVPLDGRVADNLVMFAAEILNRKLEFTGIKYLEVDVGDQFQDVASECARRENVPRVELDIILWSDRAEFKA